MAKKRDDRVKEKKLKGDRECNLDGDYPSLFRSYRDFTFENIKAAIGHSRYVQILIFLICTGFFLRFYNLGFNSLWLDEAATVSFASNSFSGIWDATTAGEFNPPLFYWVEHVMLMIGNNEIILRFIPALLGVLTIPLVYIVGREFVDRNVGLIAAAAFAFSPFLVFYSQEARAYSMMLFFVTFGMVFYLKALRAGDYKDWILFGVFAALAFWSHFYALVIIGALFLYALAISVAKVRRDPGSFKSLVLALAVFTIICLPLILVTMQLFGRRTATAPTFGIQGLGIITETFRQISMFSEPVMYFLIILFIIGIIQLFLKDKNKAYFLCLLMILVFVISYFMSFLIPMLPRYLIFLTLIFFLGIAVSYKPLYALMNHPAVVYGLVLIMVILSVPALVNYYSGYSKEDWRGLSSQIQQITDPGDLVVVVPDYISQPLDYYYSNASDQTYEFGANTGNELNAITVRKGNATAYYIVTGDITAANPDGDAVIWLKDHAHSLGQYTGIYIFSS